jgi:chromosome segregation ATPase
MRSTHSSPGRAALGCAIVSTTFLAVSPVLAQTARSGSGNESARQMQQLAAERGQLQSENARLKQELDALKKQQETASSADSGLKQRAQASEANASRLAAANAATTDKLSRTEAQMEALVAKFRETAQALKDVETERNALRSASQKAGRDYAACHSANGQLIEMNGEVLDRLEHTGFWTKAAADEPFTRLKRTQLQNLSDEYRARAAELTVAPPVGDGGAKP